MLYIPFDELKDTLTRVLSHAGCDAAQATLLSDVFARNSLEGVYSHGVNRFPRFIGDIASGCVDLSAQCETVSALGGLEVWDGHFGAGPIIATQAMDRAIALSKTNGIACVAVRNSNHWLRPGRYGYQAAQAGVMGLLFTNTIANMPAWGALDARLGNNPIVLAIPRRAGDVVVDMAMSQFAYGKLEVAALAGDSLPIDGGFDRAGKLTRDPAAILETRRTLPTGYWKGSAMSLALDLMSAGLSLGRTVSAITNDSTSENGLSQVFIAINYRSLVDEAQSDALMDEAIAFLLSSTPADEAAPVRYPGQNRQATIARNLKNGVPVNTETWERIEQYAK